MKFMKQILLATVSAMFLLVFASAADLPIVEDYAAPDCGISTDDYEAVPAAVEVVEGLEWEDIPTWESLWTDVEESDEDETDISPREARSPPLSVYNIVSLTGTRVNSDGTTQEGVTEYFNVNMQNMCDYYPESTKNTYSVDAPIVVVIYKYGNGSGIGFKSGTGYTVDSGRPYDFVKNSYGDAVGYKFNDTITITDKSLTEITLPSTARSRVAPYNTYTRDLTIHLTKPQ